MAIFAMETPVGPISAPTFTSVETVCASLTSLLETSFFLPDWQAAIETIIASDSTVAAIFEIVFMFTIPS